MVQCRETVHVGSIYRALVIKQELHHGRGTNSGCSVQRQLTTLVLDSSSCTALYELFGHLKIILRGTEVERRLRGRN
ncbi:hypothetical protein FH972_021990 [Carpinus fangiana]|uniref:Uncharacterized protein n=1 Tax=Carpinus fangiana TaxID=176857 RepID=A0A5N6KRK5_9ROSI|nr:hypothetical protein FH972_021990 [Carpinus fangiana]